MIKKVWQLIRSDQRMTMTELEQGTLQRLGNVIWRKRRFKWQGQWFLHHDNAQSRTSLAVQQFLSSPNHCTLRITLQVTFGCSLL
jgi:hypothetical protein